MIAVLSPVPRSVAACNWHSVNTYEWINKWMEPLNLVYNFQTSQALWALRSIVWKQLAHRASLIKPLQLDCSLLTLPSHISCILLDIQNDTLPMLFLCLECSSSLPLLVFCFKTQPRYFWMFKQAEFFLFTARIFGTCLYHSTYNKISIICMFHKLFCEFISCYL